MSAAAYDPARCALCGETEVTVLVDRPAPSLSSDGRRVDRPLRKLECVRCGLVRDGVLFTAAALDRHYGEEYRLGELASAAEPLLYADDGSTRPRSAVLAGWIGEQVEAELGRPPRSLLEVGSGEGSVLGRLAWRWPGAKAAGVDLAPAAVAAARARGLDVAVGSDADVSGEHELVYSVAVLEHVPRPVDFLRRLGAAVAPDGLLVTVQPSQEEGSVDVLFSDHLHHFLAPHVRALGAAAGLREVRHARAEPGLPSFLLAAFRLGQDGVSLPGPSGDVPDSLATWRGVLGRVDAWLAGRTEIAVFGAGQTLRVLLVYSSLRNHPIAVAYDDNPERFAGDELPFPVLPLEAGARDDLDVLLTFAPSPSVLARLERLGLRSFCPLPAPKAD